MHNKFVFFLFSVFCFLLLSILFVIYDKESMSCDEIWDLTGVINQRCLDWTKSKIEREGYLNMASQYSTYCDQNRSDCYYPWSNVKMMARNPKVFYGEFITTRLSICEQNGSPVDLSDIEFIVNDKRFLAANSNFVAEKMRAYVKNNGCKKGIAIYYNLLLIGKE